MRAKQLLFAFALSASSLLAQVSGGPLISAPAPAYSDLVNYLSLTPQQLQSLESIQQTRQQAQQAIYKQINDAQQQLNALLQAGSTDANAVGQLMIAVNNLRKQLPVPSAPYRDPALNVLTPDQKAKLAALTTALQLQRAANQAVTLNLVDAPPVVVQPLAVAAPQ